jgi:salicylate 5-hydroxylase large subunit
MPDDFRLEDHGLRALRVTRRGGAVFASFSDATEPFDDYLGKRQLEIFDRVFDGRPLDIMGYMRQRIPSNWKLMFENLKDPYHASLLHVFLITFGLFRLDQRSEVEIDDSGRHATLVSRRGEQVLNDATREMRQFRQDFALQDKRLLEPVREFPGDVTVAMQTLWPNIIIQQQSNTLAMRQLVPIDPGHFDLSWTFFGYEGDTPELRQRRLRQANLMGPAGFVSLDDSEVLLLQQWGVNPNPEASMLMEMGGRGVASEPHMVTEAALRSFYKYYADVMGF